MELAVASGKGGTGKAIVAEAADLSSRGRLEPSEPQDVERHCV